MVAKPITVSRLRGLRLMGAELGDGEPETRRAGRQASWSEKIGDGAFGLSGGGGGWRVAGRGWIQVVGGFPASCGGHEYLVLPWKAD
jgi:hypothetical protein